MLKRWHEDDTMEERNGVYEKCGNEKCLRHDSIYRSLFSEEVPHVTRD